MYRVYILESVTGRRYIGLSEDVARRLQDHNSGVSTWTSKHGPWRLIWISRAMPVPAGRVVVGWHLDRSVGIEAEIDEIGCDADSRNHDRDRG